MNNIHVETAIEHIKLLVDKNKCVVCDLLNGPIVRYPCGHFACKTCVKTAEDCLLCLSPPIVSTNFSDAPSSQRIDHVSLLLTAFQDLFNLDVYKRQRLSEKLKLEKQLFPKCIQAPSKYCNKRKSTKGLQDKENLQVSFIAGENISNVSKMENTISYVQQWLKNNESSSKKSNINLPRKPFADLNVNDQSFTENFCKVNNSRVSSRKRSHLKIIDTSSKRLSKKSKKESLIKLISPKNNKKRNLQKSKCENDESGIFIDEDTVVIDSSQENCVDKDNLALIAIKEAEKLNCSVFENGDDTGQKSTFQNFSKSIDFEIVKNSLHKIPFYKKSLLYKFCNDCTNEKNITENIDCSKNLTVVIDGNQLITTITFSQCSVKNVEIVNKKSVQIQTDTCIIGTNEIDSSENSVVAQKHDEKKLSLLHQDDIISADLFNDDVETLKHKDNKDNLKHAQEINVELLKRDNKCLIIEASDSDSDISEKESTLEVTAEVHRAETYDDFRVLSALEPNECQTRVKRSRVRGHTPLSTDSSDKENYDPNRMKRQKFGKKHCNKK